jgi:O-antigen ligase
MVCERINSFRPRHGKLAPGEIRLPPPPRPPPASGHVPPPRPSRALPPEPLSPVEKLLLGQTLALVVASSWFGGGRAEGALTLLVLLVALTLPLWLLARRENRRVRWRALLPAALWIAFVGLALFNPSHLPGADGAWHERTGWLRWLPTTADRAHTIAGALPWLAALVQGAALAGVRLPPRAVRALWGGVALNGFALATVGAGFHFLGADRMLGAFEVPESTYFFATFYYKNHWAAYGALGGIAGAALAANAWRAALAGQPAARGRVVFFGGIALLTLCTLPLPGSRAGLLLAAAIVGVFGPWAAMQAVHTTERGGRTWGVALLAALALLAVGFVARFYLERGRTDLARTQAQISRHAAGGVLDLRVELTRDTWRMAQARPWFGWGVGCYEVVFPIFQGNYLRDANGRSTARFEFAHNDWLQIVAEMGAIGAALLLGAAGAAGARSWREAESAGRIALAATGLLLVYAWIDFPFHNPAVLLLWTVLVATAGTLRRDG